MVFGKYPITQSLVLSISVPENTHRCRSSEGLTELVCNDTVQTV